VTHTLYRFYSADDTLLYVGLTINPGRRMEKHRGREWWRDVARITLEQHPDLDTLRRAERLAIETERPLHNIRMNTRLVLTPGERQAMLEEGCGEWNDATDSWCGAPATHVASRSHKGGLFVCDQHAGYYTELDAVA
jgi:predicted GIY-YIG superfamily endonuclease